VSLLDDPFPKSFRDFLIDRINHFDFAEKSEEYQAFDREIHHLHEQIIPLLDEKGCVLLNKLDDQCCLQMGKVAQIAYQKGFAEAIQFLLLNLYQ
jgi:hypothetical protein